MITKGKLPRFFRYLENMKEEPAVQQMYLPPEAHLAFMKAVKNGVYDYSCADIHGTGLTIYTGRSD